MTRTRAVVSAAALVVAAVIVGALMLVFRDSGASVAAFCDQLNDIYRTSTRAELIDLEDTVTVEEELRAMQQRFDGLRDVAPSEVADDVETIAEWADRVAQAALDNPTSDGFDRASALTVASQGAAALDAPLQRLDTYRAANC